MCESFVDLDPRILWIIQKASTVGDKGLVLHWFNKGYKDYSLPAFLQPYCIPWKYEGCPRGVMIKAMDCEIVVSEFILQSRYYVHFQVNTLEKGMNPLILPAMG